MSNTTMPANINRLVSAIKLTENTYLFPIFEAVINSIQAIHEKNNILNNRPGTISIFIKRAASKQIEIGNSIQADSHIEGFDISDDGIGFNKANFESFKEIYTEHKIELGGKGVGRFMMLTAFAKVIVESIYLNVEDNKYYERHFEFSLAGGVKEINNDVTAKTESKTIIKLHRYKQNFLKNTSADLIAEKILAHSLIYFINKIAPNIIIYDDDSATPISLNNLFDSIYEVDDTIEPFQIDGNKFDINILKNFRKSSTHKISYCANDRVVKEVSLATLIPVLTKNNFEQENKGKYSLDIYCKGQILDDTAEMFRDDFKIPNKIASKKMHDVISLEELNNEIRSIISNKFVSELSKFEEVNVRDLKDFIYRENLVEYRHLLQHKDIIKKIPSGISDQDKDTHLHKANYELERTQKALVNEFLSKNPQKIQNSNQYTQYFEDIEKVLALENDLGQARLAKYMMHRKTVLKVFEKFLEIQTDGTYKQEKDIHDIIFRRDASSNQINFNEHNLWILDERLAYHQYVASDKKFKDIEVLGSPSDEKADLFIYDSKFAYDVPNESVVIFEFKRPMRKTYTEKEKNVGEQIKRYINTLLDNDVTDYKGRPHKITRETPKFGFVICDYTTDIEERLIREAYKKTPKGTYFKFEEGLMLFIEVMTYEQLLADANTRHKAFFNRLGIDGI